MPRPCKCRMIRSEPAFTFFAPGDMHECRHEVVTMTKDEFEALRLADYEEIYQEAAAQEMNVSRQTFGNILDSAHRKIAAALVFGKAVQIEGGFVTVKEGPRIHCHRCRHEWIESREGELHGRCPRCGCRINDDSDGDSGGKPCCKHRQ